MNAADFYESLAQSGDTHVHSCPKCEALYECPRPHICNAGNGEELLCLECCPDAEEAIN